MLAECVKSLTLPIKKNIVEENVEARGHLCMFFPKSHCNLTPLSDAGAMQRNTQGHMQTDLSPI